MQAIDPAALRSTFAQPARVVARRRLGVAAGFVLVIAGFGCSGKITACPGPGTCDADAGPSICTSTGDCEEAISVGSPTHTTAPIDYSDPPPAGGPHNPCWTSYGVHSTEVLDENWVHNLEHGGVVFVYQCPSGCPTEAAALAALVPGRPMAVVTSYSEMGTGTGFAVVSWGHRLVTETLDVDAFALFYAEHVNHGLESVSSNPPTSCVVAP
jgi:hypothetical protein